MYSENQIKVEACPWMDKEADEVAPDGRVRMKGFSIIEPGARMFFKPYNIGSRGNRYRTLFSTEHCEVMRSGGGVVIEKWRFGKRMTLEDDRLPWPYLKDNYDKFRAEGRWLRGVFWFGFDVTHSWMMGTENMLIAMMEELGYDVRLVYEKRGGEL